jgi:Domain of unknown function (DUF4292)
MRKIVYISTFAILFLNCKSTSIQSTISNKDIENKNNVLDKIYQKNTDFKTMFIKSSIKFEDENQSQRVSVDIKIKKDEIIWVNVKLLGFPLAKAYITPQNVQFFEKINNTYFEGDFSIISNLLGTELDFEKIQNMILGLSLEKIDSKNYNFTLVKDMYQFNNNSQDIEKTFAFEIGNLNLKKQNIIHLVKNIGIKIDYNSYQNLENLVFPQNIKIIAQRTKGNANIDIEYNSIKLNEELTYPYSVSSNYKLRNF